MTIRHYCYVLEVVGDARYNYVGYTVNMARRIRQHNGELVGGAKITSRKVAKGHRWRVIALLTSEQFDHRRALSCEWWIKHPTGRRKTAVGSSRGSVSRIEGLVEALANPKFAADRFTVWVEPTFRPILATAMRKMNSTFDVFDLDSLTPKVYVFVSLPIPVLVPEPLIRVPGKETHDITES